MIIPTYNNEVTIGKALLSVARQTYSNIEIILVDDGSTDRTVEIIQMMQKNYPTIRLIQQDHGGVARSRNNGVKNATGEYIAFVDSDDTVEKDYLAYLMSLIEKFQTRVASCQHTVYFRNGGQEDYSLSGKASIWVEKDWLCRVLRRDKLDLSCFGKLYDRSLFENIVYPPDKLFEDTSTTYKLIAVDGLIAVGNESKYNYLRRNDSITTSQFNPGKIDLIPATVQLTDYAIKLDERLHHPAKLRNSWAAISVMNSILLSDDANKYRGLLKQLRANVRRDKKYIYARINKDQRLKAATVALSMGVGPYNRLLKLQTAISNLKR